MPPKPKPKPTLSLSAFKTPTSPPPRRTTPSAFVDAALELPAPSVDAYSRRQGRPFVYVLREGNSEEGAATVSKTGGCEQCEGCLLSGSILDAQHQYEALSNSATVKGFIWRYDSQCDKAEVIGRLRWAGQNKLVVILDLELKAVPIDSLLDLVTAVNEDQERKTTFVIRNLGKPTISSTEKATRTDPSTDPYTSAIYQLALIPDLYLELSGVLSFFDIRTVKSAFAEYKGANSSSTLSGTACTLLRKGLAGLLMPLIESFGCDRIIYGSSCAESSNKILQKSDPEEAGLVLLEFHYSLCLSALLAMGLEGDALDAIFAGSASRVYDLQK